MGNQTIGRRSPLARRIGADGTPWVSVAGGADRTLAGGWRPVGRPYWKVPDRTWLESSFIQPTIVGSRFSSML